MIYFSKYKTWNIHTISFIILKVCDLSFFRLILHEYLWAFIETCPKISLYLKWPNIQKLFIFKKQHYNYKRSLIIYCHCSKHSSITPFQGNRIICLYFKEIKNDLLTAFFMKKSTYSEFFTYEKYILTPPSFILVLCKQEISSVFFIKKKT